MDWFFKAVLTAGAVLLGMAIARRCGLRLAGMMAALPTLTAPTLAWLAYDRDLSLAIAAAIASVSVCAMLAMFALGYSVAARRVGPWGASLCGASSAALLAVPALAAGSDLGNAILLAEVCCALVYLTMPRCDPEAVAAPCSYGRMTSTAAATGVLAALVATFGPAVGGFATGLLASLPLTSGGLVVMAHTAGGHRAVLHFLRGYVWGLFGKIAFGAVFAVSVRHIGVHPALLLACASAVLVTMVRPRSSSRTAWAGSRAAIGIAQR